MCRRLFTKFVLCVMVIFLCFSCVKCTSNRKDDVDLDKFTERLEKLTKKDIRAMSKSERQAKAAEYLQIIPKFKGKDPRNFVTAAENAYALQPSNYQCVVVYVSSLTGRGKEKAAAKAVRKFAKANMKYGERIISLVVQVPSLIPEFTWAEDMIIGHFDELESILQEHHQACAHHQQNQDRFDCLHVRNVEFKKLEVFQHFLSGLAALRGNHALAWDFRRRVNLLLSAAFDDESTIAPFPFMHEQFSLEYIRRVYNDPKYQSWSQKMESTQPPAPIPLFIVSLPRSGTTLLTKLLSAHSKVYSVGEPDVYHVSKIKRSIWVKQLYDQWTELRTRYYPVQKIGVGFDFVDNDNNDDDDIEDVSQLVTVDKSVANFIAFPVLALAHPGAKFIFLRRNVLDVASSCHFKSFVSAGERKTMFNSLNAKYTFNHTQMAEYFGKGRILTDSWIEIAKQIPNWADRIMQLDYTDIVDDPEAVLRKICTLVGIEFEQNMVPNEDKKKTKKKDGKKEKDTSFFTFTASKLGVSQGLNSDSLQRYKRNLVQLEEFARAYNKILQDHDHPLNPDVVQGLHEMEELQTIQQEENSLFGGWF